MEYDSELLEDKEIDQNEILFISDIEHFTSKIKKSLIDDIKKKNFKAVVLIGDILSGFSTLDSSYKIFQESQTAFEMFYDVKKIKKKYSKKKIDEYDLARYYVGNDVSEKLSKEYSEELKYFKSFMNDCFKMGIPVVLFSGNHDSLFSWSNLYNERFIPILSEIHSLKGLRIPHNFEIIKLKKDLYLTGIHTDDDSGIYEFPLIKGMIEKLDNEIKNPEKTIFVSHIPGVKMFSKLGSQDISNLKKRFKFKYPYHGHCKDYHGEYEEDGTPTISVHIRKEENEL
ncbi:MAG TPA: metallophosphoesterase [Candidatus Paceibacterota bacterium]|nr:metallophosphoesterase [Candidatus Paceibacterota bacterium]